MMGGSDYIERELGLTSSLTSSSMTMDNKAGDGMMMDVRGVTAFFFALYLLMATQDIAVDGWALTMLSKRNRGKGPVCNSIGQNIGYFLSYVGFLALNDVDSSEQLWRPMLGLPSNPAVGLVSLGGFVKCMGGFMLGITVLVGLWKKEVDRSMLTVERGRGGDEDGKDSMEPLLSPSSRYDSTNNDGNNDDDDDHEIDAYEIGIVETYRRLWSVVKLPAVQSLIVILLTYRLPCALSDNVKFLKAVEFGLSKQTTALLSPTVVLPLGILVPIIATKIFHGHPLTQFMYAYKFRVTLVALVDVLMLLTVRSYRAEGSVGVSVGMSRILFWTLLVTSTAFQAIVNSMQMNAQMTFFASRVDPAIGGSYMTLLNTFANLGGTWPSSVIMYIVGQYTVPQLCKLDGDSGVEVCTDGRDAYFPLQAVLSILGCCWIYVMGKRVQDVAELPDVAWRTQTKSSGEEYGEEEQKMQEHSRKGGKIA